MSFCGTGASSGRGAVVRSLPHVRGEQPDGAQRPLTCSTRHKALRSVNKRNNRLINRELIGRTLRLSCLRPANGATEVPVWKESGWAAGIFGLFSTTFYRKQIFQYSTDFMSFHCCFPARQHILAAFDHETRRKMLVSTNKTINSWGFSCLYSCYAQNDMYI